MSKGIYIALTGHRGYRYSCLVLMLIALGGMPLTVQASQTQPEAHEDAMISSPGHARRGTTQLTKTLGADGLYHFKARFRDFEGGMQSIAFAMPPAWSLESTMEFGVSPQELASLNDRCHASSNCDSRMLANKRMRYFHDKGMRVREQANGRSRMFVNVPIVVARNRARVMPIVRALRAQARRGGHGTRWMVRAAVAFVQGGMAYRQPGKLEHGRHILGFYPPPRALEQGYGDCDTKSALLAAILQNLTHDRIIGVHVPDHYLLGIAGTPGPGQTSINYEGETYVLVEAAGPATRHPGEVSDTTLAALQHRKGLRIDPMY